MIFFEMLKLATIFAHHLSSLSCRGLVMQDNNKVSVQNTEARVCCVVLCTKLT